MDVRLGVLGRLNLNDKVDRGDVQTARGNIGGDEHVELLLLESLEGNLSLVLSDVAVHDLDIFLDFVR